MQGGAGWGTRPYRRQSRRGTRGVAAADGRSLPRARRGMLGDLRPRDSLGRLERRIADGELALALKVDGLEQDAFGLVRRVEAHRVLGLDEVEAELRLALQVAREVELGRRASLRLGCLGVA